MPKSIPIIACGKIPGHRSMIPQLLQPEFEVLQDVFNTVEAFDGAFPALLASETKKPIAVVMGGGFDQEEFDRAYRIPGGSTLPWLRPLFRKPGNDGMLKGRQTATAEEIASSLKKAIQEVRPQLEAGKGAGEVWYWA